MTLNPIMSRERVTVPPRPALTKADKVKVWNAQNGLCPRCLKPVPLEGAGVEYDHDNPRELSADDSLGNMSAMHPRCHSEKTLCEDRPRITKAHHQESLTRAKVQKPGGFRKDPLRKRTVLGQVVRRDA